MTLLSRLFKKKPKLYTGHQEPVFNVEQHLDDLTDDDIVNIAVGDHEPELRTAAISKLPYGETLKSLAFNHSASKLQVSARERIAALVDKDVLGFEQLNEDIADKVALLAVAIFSKQVELQEQVLNNADDDEFLCRVALEGASAKLRQVAAHRMADRASLEKLLKQSKGKDKSIYRIA
ncbi:hypothetical protein JYU12_02530, partial [bacterium AH-315-K03]|nr:hypothetical protein [bacterium AH-315-K03]